MENMLTDENMIESSSADLEDDQEQEMDKDSEESITGSEQETEPEESEQEPDQEEDQEEAVQEITQGCSCDMSELTEYMETLQYDTQQMVSSLDAIRTSCTSVIFLLLFIWAERKIKDAFKKFSGGKKNARID